MSSLEPYLEKLLPHIELAQGGTCIGLTTLPAIIKPGIYNLVYDDDIPSDLFRSSAKNSSTLHMFATMLLLNINDRVYPWPALLPQEHCQLVESQLNEISVDTFRHSHRGHQPIISCASCYGCPDYGMCQGTNISTIINSSDHRLRHRPSNYGFGQEKIAAYVFHESIKKILGRALSLNSMSEFVDKNDTQLQIIPQQCNLAPIFV